MRGNVGHWLAALVGAILALGGIGLVSPASAGASDESTSHRADHGYRYDGPISSTTSLASTRTVVLGYDRSSDPSRARAAVTPDFVAPKPVAGAAARGADDVLAGARYPLNPKIQKQLGPRGWTTESLDEAVQSGQQVRAINKATGDPATRYVHPTTGQSAVVDDVTGQVIHVGGPGFKYGPRSGDAP